MLATRHRKLIRNTTNDSQVQDFGSRSPPPSLQAIALGLDQPGQLKQFVARFPTGDWHLVTLKKSLAER